MANNYVFVRKWLHWVHIPQQPQRFHNRKNADYHLNFAPTRWVADVRHRDLRFTATEQGRTRCLTVLVNAGYSRSTVPSINVPFMQNPAVGIGCEFSNSHMPEIVCRHTMWNIVPAGRLILRVISLKLNQLPRENDTCPAGGVRLASIYLSVNILKCEFSTRSSIK